MTKEKIHEPYKKFKGFIREKGITYNDIAHLLGITTSTVSMKVNGYSDLAKEARFILGATTGEKVSFLEEDNIGDLMTKIDNIALCT